MARLCMPNGWSFDRARGRYADGTEINYEINERPRANWEFRNAGRMNGESILTEFDYTDRINIWEIRNIYSRWGYRNKISSAKSERTSIFYDIEIFISFGIDKISQMKWVFLDFPIFWFKIFIILYIFIIQGWLFSTFSSRVFNWWRDRILNSLNFSEWSFTRKVE